jgi:hypothetical protein
MGTFPFFFLESMIIDEKGSECLSLRECLPGSKMCGGFLIIDETSILIEIKPSSFLFRACV